MSTTNYSYSKLDTYEQCPFKFKLRYIDDFYVHSDSLATELGTAIHSCEERIAKAIQADEVIDYISLKNELIVLLVTLQHKYPEDFEAKDKSGRTIADKVNSYLDTGIYNLEQFMKEHPTYKIVGIEQHFQLPLTEEINFNGFIDRVFYDEAINHYYIQDIKTYATPIEKSKLTVPLQFVIYAEAVKQLYNCENSQITCQYYLPFCDLTQEAGLSPNFIEKGREKIFNIISNINLQLFKPKPTPLCNWCEYCKTNPTATEESKYLCPYFCYWERVSRDSDEIKHVENRWQGLEAHPKILEAYHKKIESAKVKEVNE